MKIKSTVAGFFLQKQTIFPLILRERNRFRGNPGPDWNLATVLVFNRSVNIRFYLNAFKHCVLRIQV